MGKFQKVSLKIEVIGTYPEIHFVPQWDNSPLGVNAVALSFVKKRKRKEKKKENRKERYNSGTSLGL